MSSLTRHLPARPLRFALLIAACVLCACANVVRKATNQFAENLTNAILDSDDPGTVRDGVPAYLLLIDGIIGSDPENATALLAGAKLYAAYSGGFVDDPVRLQRLVERAYGYAKRALCIREKDLCSGLDAPYDRFAAALEQVNPKTWTHCTASLRHGPDGSRSTPATGTRSPICRSCRPYCCAWPALTRTMTLAALICTSA